MLDIFQHYLENDNFTEYNSSALPLGVKKADNSNVYKLKVLN